jgi:hypothetical protein
MRGIQADDADLLRGFIRGRHGTRTYHLENGLTRAIRGYSRLHLVLSGKS